MIIKDVPATNDYRSVQAPDLSASAEFLICFRVLHFKKSQSSYQVKQPNLQSYCVGGPIIIPQEQIKEEDEPEIEIREIDSIILSQSCDLENAKISMVLVCPYLNLREWLERLPGSRKISKRAREKSVTELKRGILPGYHLLNADPEFMIEDYLVVDFKNVYGISFSLLKDLISNSDSERIRLLSPYKEHLSQAFARYFMRVGLPNDIQISEDYYKV